MKAFVYRLFEGTEFEINGLATLHYSKMQLFDNRILVVQRTEKLTDKKSWIFWNLQQNRIEKVLHTKMDFLFLKTNEQFPNDFWDAMRYHYFEKGMDP